MEFLIHKNVKMIVIACGTATSQALEYVQTLYNIPIIGVIEPTVKYIKEKGKKSIGIIATAGTTRSKGWEIAIAKEINNAKIQSIACPLLAPMVEEGWYDNKIAELTIKEYLKPLKKVDTLILGCTHYPLLTKTIKKQVNGGVEIINIGEYVAKEAKEKLIDEEKLANTTINSPNIEVYLTETECKFNEVASKLLGINVKAKQVKEEVEFVN